ncbi:hypothetical protein K431DRAFT_312077 [Polychaeton citri CBS 116435]|uniref:Polycomb protein VEFS-Box domain-containing protein n=1 Tax=Polychaeton citri CBS 116435 TaxID=1314669 RepID=A0A9P4UN99_9PEZI|nr:hypothetical protein K431DRAFT_312077 [Polychaeton citri CBS 116435]
MNTKDFEQTIKGNIQLYQAIARRPKSFLERNLKQALQTHQSDLERVLRISQLNSDSEVGNSMTTACEPQESQSSKWSLSLLDRDIQEFVTSELPILQIRRFQIRRLGVKRQQAEPDKEGFDWLPGPSISVRQSCIITLKVVSHHRELLVLPQAAVLEGRSGQNEPFFEIRPSKPFLLELEKLRLERNGTDLDGTSRSHSQDHFILEIAIQCNDLENARNFVGLIDPNAGFDLLETLSPAETRITSQCSIRRLPPDGELVKLYRKPEQGPKLPLDYGLDIEMGWNRSKAGSLLVRNNACQNREKQLSQPGQLPTPELSVPNLPNSQHQKVRIKWVFKSNLHAFVHHTKGWRCAICQGPDNPPHSSMTYLRLHLALHHDYLRFTPEYSSNEPGRFIIRISETEKIHASTIGPPDEGAEECYVRPQRPFDQSRYLDNKDKWTGHQVYRTQAARPGHKRGKRPREPKEFVCRPAPVPAPKRPSSPSEVQDLPEMPRRRHIVPAVPNVMFFRKSSSRVVRGGECLSDSDEDIDSTWVSQYRRRDMKRLKLSQPEIELLELLNCYFSKENANGDAFLMQVLVRFTRQHKVRLKRREIRREFMKRLMFFRKHQLLDAKTVQRCMEIIDQEDEQPPSTPTRNGRTVEPQSAARDRSNWVPGAGFTESMEPTIGQEDETHEVPADWHPMQIHREIIIAHPSEEPSGLESWLSIDQRRRSSNCGQWFRELDCFWDAQLTSIAAAVGKLTWKDPNSDFSLEIPIHSKLARQENLKQFCRLLYIADKTLTSRNDDITLMPSGSPEKIPDSALSETAEASMHTVLQMRSSHDLLDRKHFQRGCAVHGIETKAKREQSNFYTPHHQTTARMIISACPCCHCPVNEARNAIACENHQCANGAYFHLACVNLDRRPAGRWFCAKCTAA